MPSERAWQRLTRVARPLAPARAPYHVAQVDRAHPAPGWYWQPAGAPRQIYLAYNHILAEMRLLAILEGQLEAGHADPLIATIHNGGPA